MTVIDKEFDMAGKYRVLVQISEERAIPLKFDAEVSDETSFAKVQEILDYEAQQEIVRLETESLLAEELQLLNELEELNNG